MSQHNAVAEQDQQDADKLVVVDIGALGGVKNSWKGVEDDIVAVLFEPDVNAARALNQSPNRFYKRLVANFALGARNETRTLNLTKSIGCTSVLQPNTEFMAAYSSLPALDIVGTAEVGLTTYADLHRQGRVPRPDFIKADVQGFEYEVLLGFGDLLGTCLAIEVETHLHPMYRGQKLLHHIIDLLTPFGFSLRRLTPVDHFDGDVVELDAWFTVGAGRLPSLDANARRKLAMIEAELKIPPRRRQFDPRTWDNERAAMGWA